MLAGQIGLVRHSEHWVGKTVEWATDSTACHVVVFVSETECVSAEPMLVRLRDPKTFHSLEVSRFDLTDDQAHAIVMKARSMVDRPYNVPAIICLLASKVFSVPIPRFVVKWLERNPGLDCSQLTDIALEAGGQTLFGHDSVLVVPGHFEAYYRAQGWLSEQQVVNPV
jgi:hypothetical protein